MPEEGKFPTFPSHHSFLLLSSSATTAVHSSDRERERERERKRKRERARDLMEYERIEKVQTGMISPSKLRMKLLGPHHSRKKDGSNSNSSRTSPSRLEESEFAKNSLLDSETDFDETVVAPSLDLAMAVAPGDAPLAHSQGNQSSCQPKEMLLRENGDTVRVRMLHFPKNNDNGNLSAVHPMRTLEDENLDYDSNASSSSFEFQKAERSVHNQITRQFSRPMPSKWNDAEKWIMNRQNTQQHSYSKKNALFNQTNRLPVTNMVRVAPESANCDQKSTMSSRVTDTKRVDFCQPAQMAFERFSFVSTTTNPFHGEAYGGNALIDQSVQSKDLREMNQRELNVAEDTAVIPAIRSVCMRDMGTEMTPVTSQEPSRTATPIGATSPFRSPTSSIPSTPRRGAPTSTPIDHATDDESQQPAENGKKELSEQELKFKTRREIVALGVQLGKMNIAAWASKEEPGKNNTPVETSDVKELEQIEFDKRAAAWEEAEKSKHSARCKREEIKIQVWESQQKAKLEAEMRRIEAKVEQMRAQAQANMVKKIAMGRQRSEERRAAAEARKNRDAERTAAQAEYIRETGRIPTTNYICCGW